MGTDQCQGVTQPRKSHNYRPGITAWPWLLGWCLVGLWGETVGAASPVALSDPPTAARVTEWANVPPSLYGTPKAYYLGPGDRLGMTIFQVPQYSGEQEVLIDGTVVLPAAGALSVAGLTLAQASEAIAQRYQSQRILRNPQVTLNLLTPRPLRIGIAGEVRRPGSYTLGREGSQYPTLTRALQVAGGITQAANLNRVALRRSQPTGETLTIDLAQLLQSGDLVYDPVLRDGDSIFIPTATDIDLKTIARLPDASFAPEIIPPLNVVVTGEVFRPGPYTVGGVARTGSAGSTGSSSGGGVSPTVTRAIQAAGGIKPEADVRQVTIRRLTNTGQEQRIQVDLWALLQSGDILQDIVLQEGDQIMIPQAETVSPEELSQLVASSISPDSIRVNVVGEVERSGTVQVPPNTPLNKAILQAGGFNTRARTSWVTLLRLNPDGTVSQREIEVDFAQGVNEAGNPLLRNEDIVIVGTSGLSQFSDTVSEVTRPFASLLNLFLLPVRIFDLFN